MFCDDDDIDECVNHHHYHLLVKQGPKNH